MISLSRDTLVQKYKSILASEVANAMMADEKFFGQERNTPSKRELSRADARITAKFTTYLAQELYKNALPARRGSISMKYRKLMKQTPTPLLSAQKVAIQIKVICKDIIGSNYQRQIYNQMELLKLQMIY